MNDKDKLKLAHSLLANLLERDDIFVPMEVGDEIQNVMEVLL